MGGKVAGSTLSFCGRKMGGICEDVGICVERGVCVGGEAGYAQSFSGRGEKLAWVGHVCLGCKCVWYDSRCVHGKVCGGRCLCPLS